MSHTASIRSASRARSATALRAGAAELHRLPPGSREETADQVNAAVFPPERSRPWVTRFGW
jgi:hypothetical protein